MFEKIKGTIAEICIRHRWRKEYKTPSPGRYRVMVTDVAGEAVFDGIVSVILYMTIIQQRTNQQYNFKETILNYKDNPRAREYFDFIDSTGCSTEQYHDVVGMVFDADLVLERIDGKNYKVLTNRALVSLPVVEEN